LRDALAIRRPLFAPFFNWTGSAAALLALIDFLALPFDRTAVSGRGRRRNNNKQPLFFRLMLGTADANASLN